MAKDRGSKFQLLGPEAMGGHRARQGFRFQDLWIAFHLLDWVTQDGFRGVVNEGMDDVDASWFHGARRGRQAGSSAFDWEIYQLKDTSITPTLLAEILDAFHRKEAKFPATWSRYHVVATRCVERLQGLRALLRQTRNVILNHGRESPIAAAAIAEFGETLRRHGIKTDAAFVVDRVELNFTVSWVNDPEEFSTLFNRLLVGLGIPLERTAAAGRELMALISGEKVGSLLTREAVTELLDRFRPAVPAEAKPVEVAFLPETARAPARRPPAAMTGEERALISVFPGGAVLLRLPGGAHGLIDCSMAAASQIMSYLDERKVDTLDFVAISHWHVDRYNGVLSVISAVKSVRKLLVPSYPGKCDRRLGQKFLAQIESAGLSHYGIGELAATNARAVIWDAADGGGGAVRVEAFAADMRDPEVSRAAHDVEGFGPSSINDHCTVFRVSVGTRSFLVTADATIKRWTDLFKRLLGHGESFRADGLTVPHHGSRRSLDKTILDAIAEPSGFYAVVDPAPRFNLPDRKALDLVRAGNGEILVCDTAPVHLLLTRDGLFERRFALRGPGDSI